MRIFFLTSKLSFINSGGSTEEYDLIIRTLQSLGNELTVVSVFSSFNNIDHELPYQHIKEDLKVQQQLRIQYGIYKLMKKYEDQADFFWVDGHFFLYGAGLYRRLGGRVPVFAYFNREQISWPENVSALFHKTQEQPPVWRRAKKAARFWLESKLGTKLAGGIDQFAFTNPFLDQAYADFGLKTTHKAINIGDPIDVELAFQKNGIDENFYSTHNKRDGVITLFYSSRMIPGKGFDLLLTAFAKVKNKEKFHLILGGKGPEEDLIRQKIKELGLEPYVELPGWSTKEQLHNHLKKADIFVQARWRKDMSSMSLTEAQIFGLPSIIPSGGGIEWVGGKSSLCFKPDDADDLAAKIEQLGSDYELRAQLSRECFSRLHEGNVYYKKTVATIDKIMREISAQPKKEGRFGRYWRIVKNMNWAWAWKFYKKKFFQEYRFRRSKLQGKKFWEMDLAGLKIKLGFIHPYHHQQALMMSQGGDEPVLFQMWKHQAAQVPAGQVIFDFGGYNGIYGLIAGLVNPAAQVVIVEPDPVNVQHIQNNIALNNLKNVSVLAKVVTGQAAPVTFVVHAGGTGGYIGGKGGETFDSLTIDGYLKEQGRTSALMKFDIHGAEHEALLNAPETLANAEKLGIILEYYPKAKEGQPEADARFWEQLKVWGYQALYLYERNDKKSVYYYVFKGPVA